MAAWLGPALKILGPHLGTIISAATPVFTQRGADKDGNQTALLQQQVSELQSVASRNAESTRALAAQLQGTVTALERAAELARSKLRKAFMLSLIATGLSVAALALALVVVLSR